MFSDVLPTDDEEDEDDIEAHEASIQRLKVRLSVIWALNAKSETKICIHDRMVTTDAYHTLSLISAPTRVISKPHKSRA